MKLCCIIIVLFLITVIYTNEYQSKMTLHSMMTKTKTIMNAMMKYIYHSSNKKKKTSSTNKESSRNLNYQYYSYSQIVSTMKSLSKQYPSLMKVDSAQHLYNLPYPEGNCSKNKRRPCEHYIAFITNFYISNKKKPQIFISGEVHGDETVGPNAAIELISLLVTMYSKNKWIKHLLDTRFIIILPMGNPYGYYASIREEMISMASNTYKDINRDFPYLSSSSCMETIGARVINEIFIHHLIQLSLSLHGGEESLTYPYGTPNHVKSSSLPHIDMNYTVLHNKTVIPKSRELSIEESKKYQQNEFDFLFEKFNGSYKTPDHISISSIGNRLGSLSHYKTGTMNDVVYPVKGGMEDWAYSASWEGSPIITQPCKPNTYGGYKEENTIYEKKYKDALKSVMFLFEVSQEKQPPEFLLGKRNNKCILDYRNINNCEKDNGYIPRVMRVALAMIDMLQPYVDMTVNKKGKTINISWTIGGAIDVDETFLIYSPTQINVNQLRKMKSMDEIKLRYNHSKSQKGKGIWNIHYSNKLSFKERIEVKGKEINVVVIYKCDSKWGRRVRDSDPKIYPQTHIANARTNSKYKAHNNEYYIKGSSFYVSLNKKIRIP